MDRDGVRERWGSSNSRAARQAVCPRPGGRPLAVIRVNWAPPSPAPLSLGLSSHRTRVATSLPSPSNRGGIWL